MDLPYICSLLFANTFLSVERTIIHDVEGGYLRVESNSHAHNRITPYLSVVFDWSPHILSLSNTARKFIKRRIKYFKKGNRESL